MKKQEVKETSTELIVVKQLPVIEDQLLAVKSSIQQRVAEAKSLICTDDTYKQIKQVRADLNKEFAELEKRRKEIKKQILAPYEQFECVYKECAADFYMSADRELAEKIREVEDGLKAQKKAEMERYFYEYLASVGIDPSFVSVEDAGIKVGLSDSKTGLRKQVTAFIDRIVNDLAVIETQEKRDEILTEYSQHYDLSRAMLTVDNRHKMIEAERKRREEMEARKAEQSVSALAVEEVIKAETDLEQISAPVAVVDTEAAVDTKPVSEPVPIVKTTFTVWGTVEQLKALKAFMVEGGYKYE